MRRKHAIVVTLDGSFVVHAKLSLLLSLVSKEVQEIKVSITAFLVIADDEVKDLSVSRAVSG